MEMLANTQTFGTEVKENLVSAGSTPTKPASKAVVSRAAAEKLAQDMAVFQSIVTEVQARIRSSEAFDNRCKQVVDCVAEFFGAAPTWTAFYREALGKEGIVSKVFPDSQGYNAFLESPEYFQVLEMLTALRARNLPENDPTEAQRMITIRLPMSLHDSVCREANELKVSVNSLCITRMLQPLVAEMLPMSEKKRRGRRPGSVYENQSVDTVMPLTTRIDAEATVAFSISSDTNSLTDNNRAG
jgi:hypothetical protein